MLALETFNLVAEFVELLHGGGEGGSSCDSLQLFVLDAVDCRLAFGFGLAVVVVAVVVDVRTPPSFLLLPESVSQESSLSVSVRARVAGIFFFGGMYLKKIVSLR